ncbi:exosortase F system-associated membrane protein [Frigoriflavimonas asaccharolytica]|uniref:Exosortase F-associated protein n=1 Tax=Frigoriflavimonas asaccharolytica TaxID=2735899 RepID=A0A8J8G6P6_9FLAO|nr:exosortase F system-associated protein [Frigoriflavimonas asaccharolytica]NRS92168.1 exosortase F-associated protein [Frigoriflavimonas asaccharolytica]
MKLRNWFLAIFGICGLIGIRMVESSIFYDPFLLYFHEANKQLEIPDFVWGQLILHHLFRFCLNLIFSAIILQGFFNNKKWTIQGIILMILVFAITFPIYLYCLNSKLEIGYLFTFYMRRFVIQPIILLLIIPLFYYRKQKLDLRN